MGGDFPFSRLSPQEKHNSISSFQAEPPDFVGSLPEQPDFQNSEVGPVAPARGGTGRKRGRPKGSGGGRGRAAKGSSPSPSPNPVIYQPFVYVSFFSCLWLFFGTHVGRLVFFLSLFSGLGVV